jgi:DNA-binding NarL/FixJ family response regulator
MKKEPVHLLITDDHKLFRESLRLTIQTFHFSAVFYHAANGEEALKIIHSHSIDVVLLDVQMPVLNGIATMKLIKELPLKPHVIILTQFDDQALITNMLHLGANGFLSKDCEPEELERAILSVMNIGYFINELTSKVIHENISKSRDLASIEISKRELEVMVLLKDGKSSKEIASKLGLTLHTIESYRKSLMKKTHCKNVADVVSLAYRTGMVPLHLEEKISVID